MKKRKNIMAKIVAFIALFSIIIWVIGTGVLVIFSSPSSDTQISQQELQEYIESLSWSTASFSWQLQNEENSVDDVSE